MNFPADGAIYEIIENGKQCMGIVISNEIAFLNVLKIFLSQQMLWLSNELPNFEYIQ